MISKESSLPAPRSRYELLQADADTSKELRKFKDELWKYEIPRDPNIFNDNPRREKTTFGDGSSVDINVQDAGVDAAIRKVTAIFSPEAVDGIWTLVAKRDDELPTPLKDGFGVHIRTSYDGGWIQYALAPPSVRAEDFPEVDFGLEKPLIHVHMNGWDDKADLTVNHGFSYALDEISFTPDEFTAITVGMALGSLHQAREARVNGSRDAGKVSVEYPTPLGG